MRVLHVIPSVSPGDGGPSAAIFPLCHALINRGVEAAIATTNADGPGDMDAPLGQATARHGVPTWFFRRWFSEAFKYSPDLARWLRGHVSEFDAVHVHAVLSHASLAAAAACRRSGVPFVIRPLGTLAPWSLGQKSFRKRVLLAMAAKRALYTASAVHCTSEQEQEDIQGAFPGTRTVVVPLGIDAALITGAVPWLRREQHPYVLAMCRIHPKKNLETLIEAFARTVKESNADWRLIIAGYGDPEYVGGLQTLTQSLGASDRVTFAGWVEGPRKRALLEDASLFALISSHENFGLSVLEALAAGVPAIISGAVDLSAQISERGAGWIVAPTVDAVHAALSLAMTDATRRRSRADAAQALARRFMWTDVAAQIINLYQTLPHRHVAVSSAVSLT